MALKATLILENKTSYDVQDLDYELHKPFDNNYKPSATARGGIINFTLLSPMDKNLVFHEWLLSVAIVKEGIFKLPLTHGVTHIEKEIKFQKAHCVRLNESYSSFNQSQMYMRISISAPIIDFGSGVVFRNKDLQL